MPAVIYINLHTAKWELNEVNRLCKGSECSCEVIRNTVRYIRLMIKAGCQEEPILESFV